MGTLLGDASMQAMLPNQEHNVKWEQKAAQKDYIYHIWNIFESFCGSPPKLRLISGGGAVNRESYWVRTYRHPYFAKYKDLFYTRDTNGKQMKRLPPDLFQYLTPRALAYWYMDDGSLIGRSTTSWSYAFNTQSFSQEENIIIKQLLKDKYDLSSGLQKDKDRYKLGLSVRSKDNFRTLIEPFVLQSFKYKLFP